MEETTQKNKAAAYRMLAVETAITSVVALLLFVSVNSETAYSAALGGLAYIVPNACFTRFYFRHSAAESAGLVLRWFYVGEAVKVVATVLIFMACFMFVKPLHAGAFFLTYMAMLILNLRGVALLMDR